MRVEQRREEEIETVRQLATCETVQSTLALLSELQKFKSNLNIYKMRGIEEKHFNLHIDTS